MSKEWEEKLANMTDEEKKDEEKFNNEIKLSKSLMDIKIQSLKSKLQNVVESKLKDSVTCCKVYKEIGCSHVDGFLCNMNTCSILGEYKNGH
jgi:hypothetical protein